MARRERPAGGRVAEGPAAWRRTHVPGVHRPAPARCAGRRHPERSPGAGAADRLPRRSAVNGGACRAPRAQCADNKKPGSLGCRVRCVGARRGEGRRLGDCGGSAALGRLGGRSHGVLRLGLGLDGGGLELGLGQVGDRLVGLDRGAEDFLAHADAALDVLAGNLHALREQGLQAVEVAHVGRLAEEREGGLGVLLEGRQLQAKGLLGVLEGEVVDARGRVGELTGRGGELLVVLVVHGDLLRSVAARIGRVVRCTIPRYLLQCNMFRACRLPAFRLSVKSTGYAVGPAYRQPEVQVSWTTTALNRGTVGRSRSQIQIARRSLVGLSSPGTSLRQWWSSCSYSGRNAALMSAKSITQPVSAPGSPLTCSSIRNECPCRRAHLCPAGTFGSQCAASMV